jgi:hypothetical protein
VRQKRASLTTSFEMSGHQSSALSAVANVVLPEAGDARDDDHHAFIHLMIIAGGLSSRAERVTRSLRTAAPARACKPSAMWRSADRDGR